MALFSAAVDVIVVDNTTKLTEKPLLHLGCEESDCPNTDLDSHLGDFCTVSAILLRKGEGDTPFDLPFCLTDLP